MSDYEDPITKFTPKTKSRYTKPKEWKPIPKRLIKFEYAKDMARELDFTKDARYFGIVSGNFIFGQFIEALFYENNWHAKRIVLSTLSMSFDNVYSFRNLLVGNYVDQLDVIVNNSFYVHEQHKIIKALIEECDIDNKFQLAVAGIHTKITQIELHNGMKITIHGSSNLRASGNLEQIMIETDETIYNWTEAMHNSIIEGYQIINKPIRRQALWQKVAVSQKHNDDKAAEIQQNKEHTQSDQATAERKQDQEAEAMISLCDRYTAKGLT